MVERLWGGYTMEYGSELFRLSTDSMVLADFADLLPKSRVVDLGCGCGALGLLLCAKYPDLSVTGIELQTQAARWAEKNAAANALGDRFSVVEGDLRRHRTFLPHDAFDAVVANPPYYPVGSGKPAQDESLSLARSEQTCTLFDLCTCAAWLLRYGGRFCLVHKPERLAELLWQLRETNLEPKRLRFVRHRPDAPISLVLVESRLGGKPGLCYDRDLILHNPDGTPTADFQRIYHQEA